MVTFGEIELSACPHLHVDYMSGFSQRQKTPPQVCSRFCARYVKYLQMDTDHTVF